MVDSAGYEPCLACGIEVIGRALCVYCEEERNRQGFPPLDEMTQRHLDTLCAISFADDAVSE